MRAERCDRVCHVARFPDARQLYSAWFPSPFLDRDDESLVVSSRMRAPRSPPGAVNSGPVAAACAAAVAYFAYSVHYSSANVGSSANATKTAPWWRPSN